MPKTIDNDLAVTDCCPGFGSAAKYTAVSVREARARRRRDGRHLDQGLRLRGDGPQRRLAAAAAGLAGRRPRRCAAPHPVPRAPLRRARLPRRVEAIVDRVGYCVVVASEGIRNADGTFVADAGGGNDAFGHTQLGGVASFLAGRVKDALGHEGPLDPARLPAALRAPPRLDTDLEQAMAVGSAAVDFALAGPQRHHAGDPPPLRRPYRWEIDVAPLDKDRQPGEEDARRLHPRGRLGITAAARRYLEPLIQGEAPPPYGRDGLPGYVALRNAAIRKTLAGLERMIPACLQTWGTACGV